MVDEDDCRAFNQHTEYGHLVAGTIATPNHDLSAISLVCASCKTIQTWMTVSSTRPSDLKDLRCYRCGKAELTFSPIGPTR